MTVPTCTALDAIASFLEHPLIVVLVGGLVAALVGQFLTASWESRRSALEQKHALIAEMARHMAQLFSSANLAETKRDSTKPDVIQRELVGAIQEWTVFADEFEAKLRAYFRNPQLADRWEVIHEATYTFAHLSGLFELSDRKQHIARLDELLGLSHSAREPDLELLANRKSVRPGGPLESRFAWSWRSTRLTIEDIRDELARQILRTRSEIELAVSILRRT